VASRQVRPSGRISPGTIPHFSRPCDVCQQGRSSRGPLLRTQAGLILGSRPSRSTNWRTSASPPCNLTRSRPRNSRSIAPPLERSSCDDEKVRFSHRGVRCWLHNSERTAPQADDEAGVARFNPVRAATRRGGRRRARPSPSDTGSSEHPALDKRILDHLKDSPYSYGSNVAKGVRAAKGTVLERLKALERTGAVDAVDEDRGTKWLLARRVA
jgi:hypothetical protein